jgi:hypothetical protein
MRGHIRNPGDGRGFLPVPGPVSVVSIGGKCGTFQQGGSGLVGRACETGGEHACRGFEECHRSGFLSLRPADGRGGGTPEFLRIEQGWRTQADDEQSPDAGLTGEEE